MIDPKKEEKVATGPDETSNDIKQKDGELSTAELKQVSGGGTKDHSI